MKKLTGYADFGGTVGRIYDEDVYQFIREHSNFLQRLNPRKLLDMYNIAFCMLSGSIATPEGKFNLLK